MHPATKAHIYGMLEIIRQSTKSIEVALAASDGMLGIKKAQAEVKANGGHQDPNEPAYLTDEEEDRLAEAMARLTDKADLEALDG